VEYIETTRNADNGRRYRKGIGAVKIMVHSGKWLEFVPVHIVIQSGEWADLPSNPTPIIFDGDCAQVGLDGEYAYFESIGECAGEVAEWAKSLPEEIRR